jgi:MGT family glycosyltransferase
MWIDYITATAPEFRTPTRDQISTVTKPIWDELVAASRYAHPRLVEIFSELRPDVIVTDNVATFPAVPAAGVPWVRSVSTNPLEMPDPELPPALSGYPVDDRSEWAAFRAEYARAHGGLHAEFSAFCAEQGAGPLPPGEFQYTSPWLNLYTFPEEVDYRRSTALGPTWHRLDTSVRQHDAAFDVAERVPGEGPVVYLSLGSLGCLDVGLMQRLIDVLDAAGRRVVVSLGPRHAELRLGENMYGEEFLPQPSILSQCDLVITHGGNNTFNEAFWFGLPMIGLPLFWDQYDNAQRTSDTGVGVRLDTYRFEDRELTGAIDRLLGDDGLRRRLADIRARVRAAPGRIRGAELLERLARTREPVSG